MKAIATLGLRFSSGIFLIVALLMVFGVMSYFSLPAREDPKLTIREAVVVVPYPGMSAERVDTLITQPMAEAIQSIPEMKEIRATSMEGQSIIHAEVEFGYPDLEQIWDELRSKVEETRDQLPPGALTPIINDEFGDVSVITLALQSDEFDMFELGDLSDHIREQIYTIDGTNKVEILGRPEERVYIEMPNAMLAQLGVSLDAIAGQLQAQNIVIPGGSVETESRSLSIEPSGNFQTLDEIENALIRLPGGSTVRLGDYAQVKRTLDDPPGRRAYFNSDPAIIFAVSMNPDVSVLNYSERAVKRIDEIRQSLPAGVELNRVTYQAEPVETAVYGVSINVLQTLVIVLAVVILFLGLRTGLIVGSIVPAVVLTTLAMMGFFEIRIQRMSLATIVIALGLLVDNGIVIAEDYKNRIGEGVERKDAVGQTVRELALPLLSSTITTILVFLPLMLAQDGSGEYTRSIAQVILISLTSSWFIAMLVTPVLCYWFAKPESEEKENWRKRNVDKAFGYTRDRYEGLLKWLLTHKALFLGGIVAAFLLAGFGMSTVKQEFFPQSDRPEVLIYADLPVGTSSVKTDDTMSGLSRFLNDKERYPDVDTVAAYSGFGGPRFVLSLAPVDPAPNRGFMVVRTKDAATRDAYVKQFRADLASEFPGVRLRISSMFLGPSDTAILQAQVRGPDSDTLIEAGDRLAGIFKSVPGTIDVFSDWKNPTTQLDVTVDQGAARQAGVTSTDVATALSTYFSGRPINVFREGDDNVPIVVRGADRERTDPARVQSLVVYPMNGGPAVTLGEVARISYVPQPGRIQSEDLIKTLTIEGRPLATTPEDMIAQIQPQIDELEASLPPGHFIEYDGIIEQQQEGNAELFSTFPAVLAVIVILMVFQFNGFKRTGIVMLILPLSIIGAALGLILLGASFGFMVILGLFALIGILINNAIVLIDRIDIERSEIAEDDDVDFDKAARDAVISACLRRFRPIMMTMITTIVGLLPLIIAQDVLFYGMSAAIAGGLIVGTILTLGVVPVLYTLFFDSSSEREDDAEHKDGTRGWFAQRWDWAKSRIASLSPQATGNAAQSSG
ncbi:MAG: efflux RND transporter permease subunit [Pseudomonadota bacterium]